MFGRLCLLLQLRAVEEAFHRFAKVFYHMPAIKDLLGSWSAVRGSTLLVFGTISTDDFDSWMVP